MGGLEVIMTGALQGESDSEVQRICNRKERTERKKRSVVVLECLLKMWRHLALGDS